MLKNVASGGPFPHLHAWVAGASANVRNKGTLVSRIRSSHVLAAPLLRISVSRGHQKPMNLVWFWFRSSLGKLAAEPKRTSEPPHCQISVSSVVLDLSFALRGCGGEAHVKSTPLA